MLIQEPTKQNIIDAHRLIKRHVHHTPIMSSRSINTYLGCKIYFKCENLQKIGAFKLRGAINAVFTLSKVALLKGVATHSSGNHAAAVAYAAHLRNIPAYIVMPKNSSAVKISAVEGYGAEIIFCEPNLNSREEELAKIVKKTGAMFIPPYDSYSIIAGQATCAKEIVEELSELDFLIVPVGGGGLLSGTGLAAKYFSPKVKVIGAEPRGADDAARSFKDGVIHPSVNPQTVCDGLLTQLSEKTFSIIKTTVSEIITAEEVSII